METSKHTKYYQEHKDKINRRAKAKREQKRAEFKAMLEADAEERRIDEEQEAKWKADYEQIVSVRWKRKVFTQKTTLSHKQYEAQVCKNLRTCV